MYDLPAGRPILNTLLHSGIGDIVAVVSRYFGGVTLGKGGLSRAYAGAVPCALQTLPTDREERYTSTVEIRASVPVHALGRVRSEIAAMTSGEGVVETAM